MIKIFVIIWSALMSAFMSVTGGNTISGNAMHSVDEVKATFHNQKNIGERDFEIGGQKCDNVYCTYIGNDPADRPDYYIFKNEAAADKAFEYMRENWLGSTLTDEGDDYIQGWEMGVCDASIELLIFKNGNMIVTGEIQITSDWVGPDGNVSSVSHSKVKDYIFNTWR